MESLILKQTSDTPAVTFDYKKNEFHIYGKSLPENASRFYKPLYDWIDTYCKTHKHKGLELNINIDYMNSSSIKLVFFIFNRVNEYYATTNAKANTCINWSHQTNDDLIKLKGEEFKSYLDVPFNLIAID